MEARNKSCTLISFLIVVFLYIIDGNKTNLVNERSTVLSAEAQVRLLEMWKMKSNETYDEVRGRKILHLIGKSSGIYQSKSKAKRNGVEKTVLLSVISLSDGKAMGQYKQMLRNWLCYTAHYDYMPVVYFLSQSSPTNQSESVKQEESMQAFFEELKEMNENTIFVDYPTHLFWSLLSKKTKWRNQKTDRNIVDFEGDHPSFAHHGALVMLVPILEVLELGHSVIYMDIDIALVRDPVPFIALGTSDINVSPETRTCTYSTKSEETRKLYQTLKTEPNTGLMLIRATSLGIGIMRNFLSVLVDENRANDQPYLTDSLGFKRSTDCHYNYSKTLSQNAMKEGLLPVKDSNGTATLCIMQDILFQNGHVAFTCAEKDTTKTEYMLITGRLARLGSAEGVTTTRKASGTGTATGAGVHTNQSYLQPNASYTPVARRLVRLRDTPNKRNKTVAINRTAMSSKRKNKYHRELDLENDLDFVAPLTVHANYCGTKHRCFADRGLWLLDIYSISPAASAGAGAGAEELTKFRCKAYNKEDTKYGKPKWISDVDAAEVAFTAHLEAFRVGDVVQYGRNPEVYIVDYPDEFATRRTSSESGAPLVRNKGLRLVQNMDTLDKLGLPPVRAISHSLENHMIIGADILDLKDTNISYTIDLKQNISFYDVFNSYKKYEHSIRMASGLKPKQLGDRRAPFEKTTTDFQKYWRNAVSWTVGSESPHEREDALRASMLRSRGVYRDSRKAAYYGLENTLLLTVLSYDDIMDIRSMGAESTAPTDKDTETETVHGSYANMLRNYLRSMRQYGLKPLLYVTPSQIELGLDSSAVKMNILQVLSNITGSNTLESEVEIVGSYPNLLLFSFFSSLTSWALDLLDSSKASSFKGRVPNVYSFGVLMMLVPILEAVSMGYSVIFMDATVKVYRDSIPYLSTYRAVNNSIHSSSSSSSSKERGEEVSLKSPSEGLPMDDVAICKESSKRYVDCKVETYDYSLTDGGHAYGNGSEGSVGGTVNLTNRRAVKDIASLRSQSRPNLSIMKFAGTANALSFLNDWIQDIVASGDRTGRESLDLLLSGSNTKESFECNYDVAKTYSASPSDTPLKGQGLGPLQSVPLDDRHGEIIKMNISAVGQYGERRNITYCFLNAVLFTAHTVSSQCYKKKIEPVSLSSKKTAGSGTGSEETDRAYAAILTHSDPSYAAFYEPEGKGKYYSD